LIKGCYDKDAEVRERLAKADDEIKKVLWYDYFIFNDHHEGR